jgi:Protein of unknown function (DUF3575)
MKKTFILFLLIVLTLPSFSQEKSDVSTEKNVLKVNTLSLILTTGSVFYERKLSDLTSAQFGIAYVGLKIQNTKFTGIILTPEFRIYPKKNAIDGFYIAPYLRYQNYTLQSGTDKGSLSSMGGGLLFGRQWITKSGFTMDLFFGGHYGSSNIKGNSGTDTFDTNLITGFGMRVGFALGFAF